MPTHRLTAWLYGRIFMENGLTKHVLVDINLSVKYQISKFVNNRLSILEFVYKKMLIARRLPLDKPVTKTTYTCCMSVFNVWSSFLDYVLFITAGTLVSFIILAFFPKLQCITDFKKT